MNWRKFNRWVSVTLIGVIQALFLFMIFKENQHSDWISILIVLISLLLLIAHVKAPLHHEDHVYEHIWVAIWIPVGAVAAYYINNNLHLGAVIAAGLVGTLASILPEFNKKSGYLKQLPAAIYCGAFIGMSSPRVANGVLFVIAASVFAGILLVLSKSLFHGMGGKLGLIAFAGVVIASFVLFLFSNHGF
jgi:hypothetical protein